MPHYYYKKGDVISRNEWVQGASYHYTYYDDVLGALRDLAQARKLYAPHLTLGEKKSKEALATMAGEYSEICLNMAAALEAHRNQKGGLAGFEAAESVKQDLEKHNVGLGFGRDPQIWFNEAKRVCKEFNAPKLNATACYLEAVYCNRLLSGQKEVRVQFHQGTYVTRCRFGGTEEEPQIIRLPDASNPFLLLTDLIKRFPQSSVCDEATFVLAKLQNEHGLYVEALATIKEFRAKHKKSIWRSDALSMVQEITHPLLDVGALHSFTPGQNVELEIKTRNIKELKVEAFEIDLAGVYGTRKYLKDHDSSLGTVDKLVQIAGSKYLNRRNAAFLGRFKTADKGEYQHLTGKMSLSLPKIGAYVVELSDKETTYRSLVVVSEIAMIRKTTNKKTIVYVGSARDGKPVKGADVLVRQEHRSKGLFGWYDRLSHTWGNTSEEGTFVRSHEDSGGQRVYIEAFAHQGKNYALTPPKSFYPENSKNKNIALYGFTDRPVYRPSQTIAFVGNLRRRVNEDYENLPQEKFKVTITDPKGSKIFDQILQADDYGVVSGSIRVGDEPPLGAYQISYRQNNRWVGSHRFRIEEYKKPEFEVVVSGPDQAIRAGDRFDVKIHGEFYFGGGVAQAKVAWRIYREAYYPTFNLLEPYAYLYGSKSSRLPGRYRPRNRELVAQGQGVTDAAGDLVLAIDSQPWKEKYAQDDHRFVVEADLTDLSRRTISGRGDILAPRRGLFAHVEANQGFYRAGEKASFEIRLQKPDGSPAESEGQVVVYRMTSFREGDKIVESRTQIASNVSRTDAKGRGQFDWQTDSPGRFVVRYVTQDKWGEAVVGEHHVWVTSPDYNADDFQLNNVEIVSDKAEYKPGEKAFLMINCQFPDSFVMVSVEAGKSVLSYQMLKLHGKTAVMTLPILENYAPNVYVSVTMIHGGKFYVASQEILVPPTHKFMDVALNFDKETYLPGEMATLAIDSRDENGEGIPAQFSLRVMDKAITYIAQDSTVDIRKFFYGTKRSYFGGGGWNSISSNSGQFSFGGRLIRNRKWKNYRYHGMPPGFYFDLSLLGKYSTDKAKGKGMGATIEGVFDDDGEAPEEELERDSFALGGLADSKDARRAPGSPARRGRVGAKKSLGMQFEQSLSSASIAESGVVGGQPEVRQNFSELAFWDAQLQTDSHGKASLRFKFPDSLTTWVATLRGLTKKTIVGNTETTVKTTKNILVRMQAPRFFTERDEILVSGIVRNDFDKAVQVKVSLAMKGKTLTAEGALERTVEIGAKSEHRVDWLVKVRESGEAELMMKALCSQESDAMRMTFPVLSYGINKIVTETNVIHGGNGKTSFAIDIPAQRRTESTELELTLAPSLASSLLEALPYLIEYPYGCTEQTMSRFLPAVVVAKTLKDMGISLDEIASRRADLSNKEKLNLRNLVPVYSQWELDQVVKAGLRRLAGMQNSDGGFGWWRSDKSSMHLTAYVLQGLAEAKATGYAVPDSMIKRSADWLEREVKEVRAVQPLAFASFALATAGRNPKKLLDFVFARRDDLSIQNKAQLALAFHRSGDSKRATLVMRNLNDFVQVDKKNGIAWWHGGSNWWYWYDDEVETNAYMLLAMSEIAPQDKNLEALSRWMIFNRSGNRWKSTRDTATAILALAKYMKASGEDKPNYEVVVRLGCREIKRLKITASNMFMFDNKIRVRGAAIHSGPLPIEIEKIGRGKLYITCRVQYFSLEDKIKAAGYQIEVARRYYALKPIEKIEESNGTSRKTLTYERREIKDLDQVPAGTEVEVKLFVTSANNYEYIMLEDRKPAGFEPLQLTSGRRYGNGVCSNMELRDEKVVFFITWLQKGTHEISYRMRAEIPGTINAMPCRAEAMYAPKLGGISDSWKVRVTEDVR